MVKLIRVDVTSMCRTDELGDEFTLHATPELEKAILTINDACSKRVQQIKHTRLTEFLLKKRNEIISASNSGESKKIIELLLEVCNYERNSEFNLRVES